jgi:hypothetical protein
MLTSSAVCASAQSQIRVLRRSCCAGSNDHGQVSDDDQLEGLTVEQLEALHAALVRLSALTPNEQATVLQGLLDGGT